MTREQALKRLAKVVGKAQDVRLDVSERVSSPERRAEADASYERVKAEIWAIDEDIARIIAEHTELQRLYARKKELRPLKEKWNWERFYYKFRAGKTYGGIGTIILGSGDTWEEVIAAAEGYAARQRAENEARASV